MFRLTGIVPKARAGQKFYCNCQRENCFPCQSSATVIGDTEDGSLQLCKHCRKEYEQEQQPDR